MSADPALLAALVEIERLRGALRKYGRHRVCDLVGDFCDHDPPCCTGGEGVCTCGLDAALQPAEGEGETDEPLANAFKWLMDAHVMPAIQADLNVLSVLDVRVLAREYAATLPSPSLAPLREHEREIARRVVEKCAARVQEEHGNVQAADPAYRTGADAGIGAAVVALHALASSDEAIDAMIGREP